MVAVSLFPKRARAGVPDAAALAALGSQKDEAWLHDDGLLGLEVGQRIDRWVVVGVHAVRMGAVAVVMKTESGETFQIDVLRRDPQGPAGIGNTETLSLYLSNQGRGQAPTDEEHGLGAMALAAFFAAQEEAGLVPPKLLTLDQRNQRHPQGVFSVLSARTSAR